MAKILVTGAAGFIGSHLCRALLERGDEVIGLDDFNDFYDPSIKEKNATQLQNPRFTLVRGSLLNDDIRARAFAQNPEAVVHLAAWAGVRPSIKRPLHYQEQNVTGTAKMLESARLQKQKPKFIFASSSSVYGKNESVPFKESDPVDHPISPYAATKKAGELLAYTYHHLYDLQVTCLRFFTVYGPGQRPDLAIHKFAKRMLAGKSIPKFGAGLSARDYTYVDDTVQGVIAALDVCAGYHIYNIGNSETVTLNRLIETLEEVLGVRAIIDQQPEQPGDVPLTFANIDLAQQALGYAPCTKLRAGLGKFAAWLEETS